MVRNYIASNLKTNSGDPYDLKVSFFNERMSSKPSILLNNMIFSGLIHLKLIHSLWMRSPFSKAY